jgi:putative ABC transport system permease protein
MWIENLRGAYRSLRSAPGFALTAILSLGIGIGGSVAMFTLVNSIVLKPLAYPQSGQLVLVTNARRGDLTAEVGLIPLQFIRWRKEIQSFDSLALTAIALTRNLTGSGQPERLGVMRVTAGFFETLRVQPQRGRWFTESDEKRGAPNIAVLSDSLWRRRFGADPDIIGKKVLLNDAPHEVVGITPPELWLFRGRQLHSRVEMPEHTDAFLPIRFTAAEEQGAFRADYVGIARLKPGVTPEHASAELESTVSAFPGFAQAKAHFLVNRCCPHS